ncbi:ABC transporter ATP-binding protein [Agromyces badenianii]|uniref:ABC transporter ATP-binding protein n=1 Tax=Agromyces badenianii TaxID=2080742 RepID=UPI000D58DE8B|nr:ATP-binding cassette domain-containing protein [Agromyces badenianii]PWC05708.1 ABC transporter [Agromyces badenianii]
MFVAAEGLTHSFSPDSPLFADLNFTVSSGQLVAITGPSGSGKSTLLSILAGWELPSGGTISFKDVVKRSWVFQNPHGVAGRTGLDHVVLPLLARGMTRKTAEIEAARIMDGLKLGHVSGRPYRALSGGEAQRLMMARALCTDPDLLLMDEPTAQLDPQNAMEVIATLQTLAGRGPAVVIATHDPEVRAACDAEIRLGRL